MEDIVCMTIPRPRSDVFMYGRGVDWTLPASVDAVVDYMMNFHVYCLQFRCVLLHFSHGTMSAVVGWSSIDRISAINVNLEERKEHNK